MARSCTIVVVLLIVAIALFVVTESQLHLPAGVPPHHLVPPYLAQAQNPVLGQYPVLTGGPPQLQYSGSSPNLQSYAVAVGQEPNLNQNPALAEQNPILNQNPVLTRPDLTANQNPVLTKQNPNLKQNPALTKDYGGHDPVPSSYAPYPPKAPLTPEPAPACILSTPQKLAPPFAGFWVGCPTAQHKKCLSLKKVLIDDKCYKVGTPGPCKKNEIVVVDKKFYEETEILRGACKSVYSCNNRVFQEFLSYDKCCYEVSDIKKYVCPPEKNLRLIKNVFGEGECVFVDQENQTSTSEIHFQTQGEKCVVPDLSFSWNHDELVEEFRFPHLRVPHPLFNISIPCNEEERACLSKGQVLVPRGAPGALADPAGCHELLKRGPCPPGAWLVLDKSAFQDERRLLPVCDWARCAPASVFLTEDQRCISLWELQHERCSSEDIVFDVFGDGYCAKFTTQRKLLSLPEHTKNDECVLMHYIDSAGFAGSFARPPCPTSDSNRCAGIGGGIPVKPSNFGG